MIQMPRLIIHFARYGPYHHARLRAAHEALAPLGWEVVGLETAGTDATYAWDEATGGTSGPKVVTAFPGRVHEEIRAKECRSILHPLLDSLDPDAIAIAGWASPDALSCLSWCRKHDRRRIVMSETREADGKRVWWKELIKRYLISRFEGGLVGGRSHRDYLVKLGMPADKIRFGYNVVDNGYFAAEAAKYRCFGVSEDGVSAREIPRYFLASNRFIERKNLSRLVDAYSSYVQKSTINNRQSSIWPLCLLGDGELKADLIAQCHRLGLTVQESAPWESPSTSNIQHSTSNIVFFPGFRQIEELPRFYAQAGCFIHPALEEPWGLVINEAMACGLPILSSRNVGAAEDLIEEGVNGWTFDSASVEEMAECLRKVAARSVTERDALGSSSRRILEERCPTEAFGSALAELLSASTRG
jgi:glycosyltransferase involved in cell wall biosynthesis